MKQFILVGTYIGNYVDLCGSQQKYQ